MALTGKCVCGAVSYTINKNVKEVGACHCGICRAWTGGVFIGLQAAKGEATFEGEDNLTVFKSSEWAERAFCSKCGSSMFYRLTAPGPMNGELHIGAGTLEDWGDVRMTGEIYVDKKPDAYAFAGVDHSMTEAEFMAMIGAAPEGGAG